MSETSNPMLTLVAVLVGVVSLTDGQFALADWPQWRGPQRNGLAERSPSLISALGGQSPIWRSDPVASGERGGRGSLVVSDGKVFGLTSTSVAKKVRTEVFCLDAEQGTTVWRTALPESQADETGSSTPCVTDGLVYVVGSENKVHCLSAEDGSLVWDASMPRNSNKAVASSVVVVDGIAVVMADALHGFDARTGEARWQNYDIEGYESSPTVWDNGRRSLVLCNTRLETHAVNPESGEIEWSVPGGGKSTPVIAHEYGGDFLVNMSGSRKNGLSAHRLTAVGAEKLWTVRAYDRAASPVVFDGHVYAVAGGSNGHGARVLCVHLDSGQTAWEEIINFAEVSSPVVADGKMMAVCGTALWLIEATPERYSVLSQASLQITLCTSPAIMDGRVYLREANAIVCYDLRADP